MAKNLNVKSLVEIAVCSALISLSAMISIPFSIPLTMQIFGVYFSLFFLGGKRGTFSVIIYLLIGALGLPVFSGFSGGFGRLFDATGGFIWGFLLLALAFLLFERVFGSMKLGGIISTFISLILFYSFGVAWYYVFYTTEGTASLIGVISLNVLPYVLPDLIKIWLAFRLSSRLKKILHKTEIKK